MFRTYDPKRPLIEALRDKSNDLFKILQEIGEADSELRDNIHFSKGTIDDMITFIEVTDNPKIQEIVATILDKYYS